MTVTETAVTSARRGTVWAGMAYGHLFCWLETIPPLLSDNCDLPPNAFSWLKISHSGRGSILDSAAGAYSTPPDHLASRGRVVGRELKGKRREEGRRRRGRDIGPYQYFVFLTSILDDIQLVITKRVTH